MGTGRGCARGGGSSVYTSKEGDYTITFPDKPKEQSQSTKTAKGNVNYVTASCAVNAGKRVYICSSTRYPFSSKGFNVQAGLDGARNGAAKNTNATVTSEKKITNNGVAGREIEMTTATGVKARCRIFADKSGPQLVLYQAFVADNGGSVSGAEVDAFLNSFHIKKKN